MIHKGPARVFDCEEDAIAAIYAGKIVAGDVVVIRYEATAERFTTQPSGARLPFSTAMPPSWE